MNTQQLALWQKEEQQAEVHHFMEVVHFSGERYIVDTACPECQPIFRDMSVWSAKLVENSITLCVHKSEVKP
jgi:hypothetical protein